MRHARLAVTAGSLAAVLALGLPVLSKVVDGDTPSADRPRPTASAGDATVTSQAQAALRRLRKAGMPVERVTDYTRHEQDPDRLLGRAGGYRSKAAFEDSRVDGGAVASNDPGSVGLGGVVEVFDSAAAARSRAMSLRQDAYGVPSRAEYHYLAGPVLLRISSYLQRDEADEYGAAVGAVRLPDPSPTPDLRPA